MRSSNRGGRRAAVVVSGYVLQSMVWVAVIWAPVAARPQQPNIQPAPLYPLQSCPPQANSAQASRQTPLSYQQSVQFALENNFDALLARERIRETRGLAVQARAALLPDLSGVVSQESQTINLAALGLRPGLVAPLAGIPIFVGPFGVFDARVQMVQRVFNLQAVRQYQAGKSAVKVARHQEELTRQQVVTQTALAYLNSIGASQAIEAACANLTLAQRLLTLARDQRTAGVATGVDVTRAETRLAQEQVRLAQAQTNEQQARLSLLRITGLPLALEVVLTDLLRFTAEALPEVDRTVAEAEDERPEIRVAEEELRRSRYNLSAARAERPPSLDFFGDYGQSGNTPVQNSVPTRTVGLRLNITIFNGGLTEGRIAEATSRVRQAELRLNDSLAQVEEDVRLSLRTLVSAAEQVRAAQETVTLADRELLMSRDRFAAGMADNLEVVSAQTTLADGRYTLIAALTQYNAARVNLAASRGRVEAFRW